MGLPPHSRPRRIIDFNPPHPTFTAWMPQARRSINMAVTAIWSNWSASHEHLLHQLRPGHGNHEWEERQQSGQYDQPMDISCFIWQVPDTGHITLFEQEPPQWTVTHQIRCLIPPPQTSSCRLPHCFLKIERKSKRMKVQASPRVGLRIPPHVYKQSTTLQHESAADLRHPFI